MALAKTSKRLAGCCMAVSKQHHPVGAGGPPRGVMQEGIQFNQDQPEIRICEIFKAMSLKAMFSESPVVAL
jgi:hypothetical protein